MLQLPIGIDDYRHVKEKCFYFDRTRFIKEIHDSPDSSVFLYTRPRRFGKSLMVSMLSYFYDIRLESSSLFKDMAVASVPEVYATMNSLPLIHLDLKGLTSPTEEGFYLSLSIRISDLYRDLVDGEIQGKLDDSQREYVRDAIMEKLDRAHLSASLLRLSQYLFLAHGKPCLILIDEYDAPLQEAKENGYYESVQGFMRAFLGNALKGNPHLFKAVLTGVTQIAQGSIFSDLNNLVVNNILGGREEYFGFRKEETERILSYYGYKGSLEEVREWYGGYCFQNEVVYNPWSILNFISNGFLFQPYWVNTGSYSSIRRAVRGLDSTDSESLFAILGGEVVLSPLRHSISFSSPMDGEMLYSLLAYSGYLSAKRTPIIGQYELSIPNREVGASFRSEILGELTDSTSLGRLYKIGRALSENDPEGFESAFSDYLLSSFSYLDLTSEKSYQIMVLTLSSLLFENCIVRSENLVGEGRCDISILDKDNRYGYILELKFRKNRPSEASLLSSAKAALGQALRLRYFEEARNRGIKRIYVYGMAFSGKRVKVASKSL